MNVTTCFEIHTVTRRVFGTVFKRIIILFVTYIVRTMAKLSSYYTLCPLIDQQSLLGVEKDANSGCVIVTLGKNIVIRYKVRIQGKLSTAYNSTYFNDRMVSS